jgi:putative acetyltransferase
MLAIVIRPAGAADVAGVDALLRTVFSAPGEADLVRNLCVDGDMVLVLAAIDEEEDAVVGMVAFSRMTVSTSGKDVPAVALAPVAVAPDYRRQGVAEALIRAGLDQMEQTGAVLCFVLGDPAFYGRFGFDADLAHGYASPYAGDTLMALALQGGLVPCGVRERADHAPAFARLGAST